MEKHIKLIEFLYIVKMYLGFKKDIPEFFFVDDNELINVANTKYVEETVEWFSKLLDGTHKLNDEEFYVHPIYQKNLSPSCIAKFKALLAKTILYEIKTKGECILLLRRTQTSKAFKDVLEFCGLSLENFPSPLELIVNEENSIYYLGYGVPIYRKTEEDEQNGKRIIKGKPIYTRKQN